MAVKNGGLNSVNFITLLNGVASVSTRKAKLIRIHSTEDGMVHIQPNGSHDPAATLCGQVDIIEAVYTPTNDEVSCDCCRREFNFLKNGMVLVDI